MHRGHLSFEQIEEYSEQEGRRPAGPGSNGEWSHIDDCIECRNLLEGCLEVNEKLEKLGSINSGSRAETNMNCPDERVWFDVAEGTVAAGDGMHYIEHAATCAACGQRLKAAMRIFEDEITPEEAQLIKSLPSADQQRQHEMALRLSNATKPVSPAQPAIEEKRFAGWFFFKVATSAVVMAGLALAILPLATGFYWSSVVNSQYRKGRPMEYRVAEVPYGPVDGERGASRKRYVNIPQSIKAPQLAAAALLLRLDSSSAIKLLEDARRDGNNSQPLLDDLVVAYAMEAERTRNDDYYVKALALCDQIIDQHPFHPITYFNRSLIYRNLRCQECEEKARADQNQFLRLETDTLWRKAAMEKAR